MEQHPDKLEFRKIMRQRLMALSPDERLTKSLAISKLLKASIVPLETGVYASLPEEVDWSLDFPDEVFLYAGFKGKDEIGFFISKKSELKDLVWNKRAFKVPATNIEKTPKVILVPGLAMSKKGERMGRGGGYYDRYLEHFSGLKIGLTFDCCLMEAIPTESHDVLMDWVVTESGIIKIRRQ